MGRVVQDANRSMKMNPLPLITAAIVEGDGERAVQLAAEGLTTGLAPHTIIQIGLMPAMDEVGRRFSTGEMFLPDMLVAAHAMGQALELLRPHLTAADRTTGATAVLGTVAGDIHDMGKNLVSMMLQGAGFTIIDLGVNVAAETFVEAVVRHRPALLGLSALLTTTMPSMPRVVQALQAAGVRDRVKVMVGGAPITAPFAQRIGADGYAPDAASAVTKARELLGLLPVREAAS